MSVTYVRGERLRHWRTRCDQERAEHQRRNIDYRRRVLSHPELAKKLTQHPIGYDRPEQWTGFIPPQWITSASADPDHRIMNQSPQRAALVRIMTELVRLERATGE